MPSCCVPLVAPAPAVASTIRDHLSDGDPPIGLSSAACGSDILFLEAVLDRGGEDSLQEQDEAVLDRGGEVHVVLPYDADLDLSEVGMDLLGVGLLAFR